MPSLFATQWASNRSPDRRLRANARGHLPRDVYRFGGLADGGRTNSITGTCGARVRDPRTLPLDGVNNSAYPYLMCIMSDYGNQFIYLILRSLHVTFFLRRCIISGRTHHQSRGGRHTSPVHHPNCSSSDARHSRPCPLHRPSSGIDGVDDSSRAEGWSPWTS